MNKESFQEVLQTVSIKTNLPLRAEADFVGASVPILVRVDGLNPIETFYLKVERSPLAWIVELAFDLFARHLVKLLQQRLVDCEAEVNQEIKILLGMGVLVESNVDEIFAAKKSNSNFPEKLNLRLVSPLRRVSLAEQNTVDESDLVFLIESALGLIEVIAASPNREIFPLFGQIEGDKFLASCSKYERSPKNRIDCLNRFGYTCQACFIDPLLQYGPEGRKIIHVHHIVPLSLMDQPKKLDPTQDLVPLCPNCHNFVHKRTPPYSVDELRVILKTPKSSG
jgi:5-methylcytosine-specific restriction protein A